MGNGDGYIVIVSSSNVQEEPVFPVFIKASALPTNKPILRALFCDFPPASQECVALDTESEVEWAHFMAVMLDSRQREREEQGRKRPKLSAETESDGEYDEGDDDDEDDEDDDDEHDIQDYLDAKMQQLHEELEDCGATQLPTGAINIAAHISFLRYE